MKPLNKIAELAGVSKNELKEIIKEIRENNKLLDSCSFHIFVPKDKSVNPKFICENCKGIVSITQRNWYNKGINHSQKRG